METGKMDRTFVILHMLQTIDGKAIGDFWRKPDVKEGVIDYNTLISHLKPQAIALGRVTMADTANEIPDLLKYENNKKIEHKDFIVPLEKDIEYYFISYDSKGTLGFKSNIINAACRANKGRQILSQMIVVLTDEVSNEYLHYCQERKISYIFAGKNKIDLKTSLIKLKKLFGIEKMTLQGGPTIDGAFINDDLIDAISIIILPITSIGNDTLFKPSKYQEFKLIEYKELSSSNIWLHYLKKIKLFYRSKIIAYLILL